MTLFRVVAPSQKTYPDGITMCSAASILMCYYMLRTTKPPTDVTVETVNFIMSHSSNLFKTFLRPHGRIFHVGDVIDKIGMVNRAPEISTVEVGGLTAHTPTDMKTDTCMDLGTCLDSIKEGECCTITYNCHTVAFGRCKRYLWLFDSMPAHFCYSRSESDITQLLLESISDADEYSAVIIKLRGRSQ